MIKKLIPLVTASAMTWLSVGLHAADVREGLVSYWPMNTFDSGALTTPDVVMGNDMIAWTMISDDFINDPERGGVAKFDSSLSTYLYFQAFPGEDTGLPISRHPSWTVLFWVKATYPYGDPLENDRRVFSESSSADNDPLVNIGTHNTSADGTVDIFIRDEGAGVQVNHAHSATEAYDGTWHHVAAAFSEGTLNVYLDGEVDLTLNYTPGPAASADITSIGAVVRGSLLDDVAYYFTGLLDDVAVWERALTQTEIQEVKDNGIQTPVPAFAPTISLQPVGGDLLIGDPYVLTVAAYGARPLRYAWRKDDVEIPGETGPTLTLDSLVPSDSGSYVCVISNSAGDTTSEAAVLNVTDWPAPDLENGMLCYWPLNEVTGTKTPDIRSWYDLTLVNLSEADLVPGRWGNCLRFTGANKTLLERIHQPEDELPIYPYDNFTVSLWVNGGLLADGVTIQDDLRVFSEANTGPSQPLFNLGTHNDQIDGSVDTYIRTDGGATDGDHHHTQGIVFDNTWHHIAYVQRTVAGDPTAVIYIDGVADPNLPGPVRPLTLNTTSIGGIRRANPSHWFTGLIDDVALWTRALSPAEAAQLYSSGTPVPEPRFRPMQINSFTSDLPAVKAGDPVRLSWDVSLDVTVTIDPDIGDVTGQTTAGVGSVEVNVNTSTTYTLTISRQDQQLTAQVRVAAVSGIADNWSLLDNFEQYNPGPLVDTPWWSDLRGSGVIVDTGSNKMLEIPEGRSGDAAVNLPLSRLQLVEGESRTLFFRMQTPSSIDVVLRQYVGLTDKNLRWHTDADESGPKIIVDCDGAGGAMQFGTHQTQGSTADEWHPTVTASPDTLYHVWINVQNRSIALGDLFSIYLQEEGALERTPLFENYVANRSPTGSVELGPTLPDLDKLFVTGNEAATLRYDDFYLSNSGFNSTLPRAVTEQGVTVHISLSAGQITISWPSGTLESAGSIGGAFEPVQDAAPPSCTITPTDQQRFYRVRSP